MTTQTDAWNASDTPHEDVHRPLSSPPGLLVLPLGQAGSCRGGFCTLPGAASAGDADG